MLDFIKYDIEKMKHFIFPLLLILVSLELSSQTKEGFFDYNKDLNRSATVVYKQDIDSLTSLEKIVLEGHDSQIPFYLYSNSRAGNAPFVFLLHGLGDEKEDWVYPSEPYLEWSRNTTSIKDSLLQLGYNILIPDVKFHGERSYELGFRPPEMLPPIISRNQEDTKLFESMVTSSIKDLGIMMDYIENRAEEAPSFAVIGYSLGGNLAILLSVVDDRIKSVVACVPPVNLPSNGLEAFDWSEEIIQGQIDITPMNYAEKQKAPIILLMGKNDYYTSEKEVTDFYNAIPTDEKHLKFFDSGHVLPAEYKLDAIGWITKYHRN